MGKADNFKIEDTNIKAPSKILFVGDSHIEQYWERALFLSLRNSNTKSALFLTYGGCPPLPLVNRLDDRYSKFSCDIFYDFSIKRALENDVKTVVFGANWQGYFSELQDELSRSTNSLYSTTKKSRSPLGFNDPEMKNVFVAFKKDLLKFKSAGKDIYIILQSPIGENCDPLFMYDRLRDSIISKTKIGVEKSNLVLCLRPLREQVQKIAAVTGAIIIDPLEILCTDSTCPVISQDGIPLYKDSNHMRPFYVKEKAIFIDQIFGG